MDGTVDQVKNAAQLIAGAYVTTVIIIPSVIYEEVGIPYSDSGGGAVGKLQYHLHQVVHFIQQTNANNGGYARSYDGVAITNHGGTSESQTFSRSVQWCWKC